MLGALTPRGGVVGRREGLNVAQFPDPRLENRGSRIGAHTRGQGHHALHLGALLALRVVTAHARFQRRCRPHVEGVSRGVDEVIDAGGGGQIRNEVGRRGAPGRSLVCERDEVFDVGGSGPGEQVDEAQEDLSRRAGVSECPVLGNGDGTEVGGDRAQLVVAHEGAG